MVAKFLPRNGPSGWYSHACTSRADQSLSRQKPKICSAALPIGTVSPSSLGTPIYKPSSSSKSMFARRTVARHRLVRRLALALRALHRRTADAHRRGAAVIGDRHVFVVRQQRIVRPERAAGIGGVEDRSVKIGEVADRDRQQQLGLRHRREMPAQALSPRSALSARDSASRSADEACGPSDIS